MLKTLALIIAAIGCFATTFGQKAHLFAFEDTTAALYCLYDNVRVIDMRKDKTSLGYIRKGALDRYESITTEKPFDQYLSMYYSGLLSSKTTEELVILIYSFNIEDKPIEDEVGTIYIDADFYGGSNGKYYFVGNVDSLYEVGSITDVTKKLLRAAEHVLKGVVVDFAGTEKSANFDVYDLSAMKNRRQAERQKYPIYNAVSFKQGIYYTKKDFLYNNPVDTPFVRAFISSGNSGHNVFHYLDKKGKKDATIEGRDFFAIYDDGKWFSGRGEYAVKMEYTDGDFYAVKQYRGLGNEKRNAMVMSGGALGGAIGASIIIAVYAPKAAGDKHPHYTSIGSYEAKFDPLQQKFKPIKRLKSAK